nr:MAG TPA: hypothetical protein [Caudoviricetes sp.]
MYPYYNKLVFFAKGAYLLPIVGVCQEGTIYPIKGISNFNFAMQRYDNFMVYANYLC